MEFRDLEYVAAVARCQSVTQAARELGITQPSLSSYIKNLEKRLGTPVFERVGKRFVPTWAGQRMVEEGRELLLRRQQIQEEIRGIAKGDRGKLRLGFPILRGISLLPATLPAFRQLYPNVELAFYEEDASRLDELVLSGEVDLAFFNRPVDNESMEYQIISREEIVLCTHDKDPLIRKAHPRQGCKYPWLDIRLCKDEPFILNYPEQRTTQIADHIFCQAGFRPKVALQVRSLMTTVSLSALGYGMSFASEKYPTQMCIGKKPAVLSIGEPVVMMNLVAAYRRGAPLAPYTRDFIEIAKELY